MAIARTASIGTLILATVVSSPSAWAQKPIPETLRMMEPHRLRIGDYVRAWPNEGGPPIEGTIVALASSTLNIATKEEAALVSLPSIHHMNVRRTRSHVRAATAIGAGIGLLVGAFLITDEVAGRHVDAGERVAWTAGLAAGGAGLGAAVGRLTRSVTWQPVDLVTLKPHPIAARGAAAQAADVRPALRWSWTVRF